MAYLIDTVISVLMDFYADCYGKPHDETELINYQEWADKIYKAVEVATAYKNPTISTEIG